MADTLYVNDQGMPTLVELSVRNTPLINARVTALEGNVSTVQTALSGKADVGTCISITGGQLSSGYICGPDYGKLSLRGCYDLYLGASLDLLDGRSVGDDKGNFHLRAAANGTIQDLFGKPDGSLKWGVSGSMGDVEIVDEKLSDTSGYIRYRNGFQVCWGISDTLTANTNTSISVGKSFSGGKWQAVVTPTAKTNVLVSIGASSTVTFVVQPAAACAVRYIAVGMWK